VVRNTFWLLNQTFGSLIDGTKTGNEASKMIPLHNFSKGTLVLLLCIKASF
jgi:hypothetical protein